MSDVKVSDPRTWPTWVQVAVATTGVSLAVAAYVVLSSKNQDSNTGARCRFSCVYVFVCVSRSPHLSLSLPPLSLSLFPPLSVHALAHLYVKMPFAVRQCWSCSVQKGHNWHACLNLFHFLVILRCRGCSGR